MTAKRSTSRKQFDARGDHPKRQLDQEVFFVDRCLGAYDFPGRLREAGLTVEIHKDQSFNSDADDPEWLPIIGQRGWLTITSDRAIRSRQIEIVAPLRSGAPSFVLTAGSATAIQNAEAFLKALNDVRGCVASLDHPFVAQITSAGVLSVIATKGSLIKAVL
jgi:hypothetical protein